MQKVYVMGKYKPLQSMALSVYLWRRRKQPRGISSKKELKHK